MVMLYGLICTSKDTTTGERLPSEAMEPISLPMILLEKLTNNFSKERLLGQGGYGNVYRGVYDDGQEIAVKLLHNNMQNIDDEQFIREFHNLMMLNHPNIIRLVGYCYETQRQHMECKGRIVFGEITYKALCFEYMPKGSLQKHLSDECNGLDWQTRYKIIKGACEGLKYLDEDLEKPFYHLDLKPDNILLDENMVPKLADFGLSKLFGEEQTRMTQSIIGTIGYMPPEYILQNIVSKKSDIFSLGVVMTKIIAGPSGQTSEINCQEFLNQLYTWITQVQENWRKRLQATGSSLEPLQVQCEQIKRCTEIALSCMETDRHKRPSIVDIIHELNETEIFIEEIWRSPQDELIYNNPANGFHEITEQVFGACPMSISFPDHSEQSVNLGSTDRITRDIAHLDQLDTRSEWKRNSEPAAQTEAPLWQVPVFQKRCLEMQAGFEISETPGFPQLMVHTRQLRKVKIWVESEPGQKNQDDISQAFTKLIRDGTNEHDLNRSVSMGFEKCSGQFVNTIPSDVGACPMSISFPDHSEQSVNLSGFDRFTRDIVHLHQLETLDLRGSEIVSVYKQVLLLPKLKHLLGKFQLSRRDAFVPGWIATDLERFLNRMSALETLAGFEIGKRPGFPQLMMHMRRLRKVKIWFESEPSQKNLDDISQAITKFIRDGTNEHDLNRSLSMDFEKCSGQFMNTIPSDADKKGRLDSLKLRGNLTQFPPFVAKLSAITELGLCSTGLSWRVIQGGLSEVRGLKYLKLIEDNLGRLDILFETEHLKAVGRIYVVCKRTLEVAIAARPLPQLVSVHILCQDLHVIHDNPLIEMTRMAKLYEVALHHQVESTIRAGLVRAADAHLNRPNVLFLEYPPIMQIS